MSIMVGLLSGKQWQSTPKLLQAFHNHHRTHNLMAITTYPPIFKATFRIREAYGNTRAYPVSREAVLLCQLTGNKTLRAQEISTIRELGFECLDTEGHVINAVDLY